MQMEDKICPACEQEYLLRDFARQFCCMCDFEGILDDKYYRQYYAVQDKNKIDGMIEKWKLSGNFKSFELESQFE